VDRLSRTSLSNNVLIAEQSTTLHQSLTNEFSDSEQIQIGGAIVADHSVVRARTTGSDRLKNMVTIDQASILHHRK
jgi:hypothetical protein